MKPLSSPKTPSGCIARLLRHFLCLSTCPLDYLKEEADERSNGSSGTTVPGVVARLMGLESLPLIPSIEFKKLKFPRRVIPISYQEVEDDNFFIFTFDTKRKDHKRTKPRDGDSFCENNSCETQDNSEHSSPGSALEFVRFPSHHPQPSSTSSSSSSDDVSRLRNSRMRRTLSEEFDKGVLMTSSNAVLGEEVKRQWDEIGSEVTKMSWVEDEMYRDLKEIGVDISSQILGMLLDELLPTYS